MNDSATFPQTWDLDTLYPHPESPEFRTTFRSLRDELQSLVQAAEALPDPDPSTAGTWADFLDRWEHHLRQATDIEAFIECHAAAAPGNSTIRRWEAELAALRPSWKHVDLAIELRLQALDADAFETFVRSEGFFEQIRFYLEERRRFARLRLPAAQETLANELDVDGLQGWGRLYDRISSELRITVMEHGQLVQKSPGQITWDGPERSVRENNFRAADRAWQSIAQTCADALNHIAGSRLTRYRHLDVQDHLDLPLALARMTRQTLQTMWSVIEQRKARLVPYLQAKARWLGVPRLAWFDLTAPVPAGDPRRRRDQIPYDQACRTIIETFAQFSEEMGHFAERALRERWVEAENRPGKRQGGFCAGFPLRRQSRIFMTYTDSVESMSVLAHELGHAYHGHVLRDLPVFLQQYPMNLAETASTFAEAIVGDALLARTSDPADRLRWLDKRLADAVAFLMNIHCRFLFEDELYRRRPNGELTPAELDELMLQSQKTAYCDSLADDGWNPRFWASKLHFYITEIPFYNFPYTFGYLLSCGLCELARRQPDDFARSYRAFLQQTGRARTEEVVRDAFGYDLREPEFWNLAIDRIEPWVDEFVQLSEQGDASHD